MPLSIEARAARHLGHLVADVGNVMHALGIHRRGVQAHETVFANHLALAVQLAQGDEIRIGRPMHPARLGGLGKGQQDRLAQIAGGFAVDLPLTGRQPLTQHLAQAQQRAFVVDDARHTALLLHAELLEAEEGKVVVDQPAEEHLDLFQLARIALAFAFAHARQQGLGARLHRREIGNSQTHLGQHFLQRLLQSLQRADIGAAVDLQVHQRFMLHILAGTALGQQLQQFALLVATHTEHTVLQGMDAVPAAIELHAYRVDQERLVGVQHLHGGMSRLPAMLLVVGVVHPRLRRIGLEALQQTPGRQRAANQIGQAPLA